MSNVIIFKTDPKLKARAQKVVADLGLTLSAVLNGYLKDLVQNKSVSFSKTENTKGKKVYKDPYGMFAGAHISEKDIDAITNSWMKTINEI